MHAGRLPFAFCIWKTLDHGLQIEWRQSQAASVGSLSPTLEAMSRPPACLISLGTSWHRSPGQCLLLQGQKGKGDGLASVGLSPGVESGLVAACLSFAGSSVESLLGPSALILTRGALGEEEQEGDQDSDTDDINHQGEECRPGWKMRAEGGVARWGS